MKHRLTVIALLTALCASLYFVNANSHAAPAAQTWEYKTEQQCFDEKRMNALGAEGWELAGFNETDRGGWHCIFKRAK
ncbi:MAG: hypothetical protein HY207_01025 [Nitrospirae bacterium]|nr:hypothetical protein [Nitrospirota bacterium]